MQRYLARELSFPEQRRARVKELFDRVDVPLTDDQADERFASYLKHYETHWRLFPDVEACLRTLSSHRLGRRRWGRTALAERGEDLAGLNPASRAQRTGNPTTERVLAAFDHLALTILEREEGHACYVTPLNAIQRHILDLLGLPDDLYERLKRPLDNLVLHLCE